MSLMDVGTKLNMALLVLNVSDLYLWPEGTRLYWLCSVWVASEAIPIIYSILLSLVWQMTYRAEWRTERHD